MSKVRRSVVLVVAVMTLAVATACEVPDPTGGSNGAKLTAADLAATTDYVVTTPTYDADNGLQVRVFRPAPAVPGERPTIVYLHGGGWFKGDETEIDVGATWNGIPIPDWRFGRSLLAMVKDGWVVMSVEYTLADADPANAFPAALHDARRAIDWAKQQPYVDGDRVVVAGTSAGGNLAALVAATSDEHDPGGAPTTVRAAVNLDGPNDLLSLFGSTADTGVLGDLTAAQGLLFDDVTAPYSAPYYKVVAHYLGCEGATYADVKDCVTAEKGAASPIDEVTTAMPPVYLACGLSSLVAPNTMPASMGCPDHIAMEQRVMAVTGDSTRAWLDRTPGDHLSIDAELNFTYLGAFLECQTRIVPQGPLFEGPPTVAGPTSITVSWKAPLCYGLGVDTYTVTAVPGGQTCTATGSPMRTDALKSCTVNGLTPGTTYTFQVRGANSSGQGEVATTSAVTLP